MAKLTGFHKNLLVFLMLAVLLPMACRELVMVMARANRNYGTQDTLRRSSRRGFGKRFLSQLHCQSLQAGNKFTNFKLRAGFSSRTPLCVSADRVTAKAAPAAWGEGVFPAAVLTPLRI
jgi:hypothetical protein